VLMNSTVKGIRGQSKTHLVRAVELMEKHDLHPVIHTYEWADAATAFEDSRTSKWPGKLVIKI
jgi:D-arabinose 1-dehydrogenase-like Zn-dependent alcohol dehydrogenase